MVMSSWIILVGPIKSQGSLKEGQGGQAMERELQ